MATMARRSSKKTNKRQAEVDSARQSGKLVYWLILAVLGLGFVTLALS